MGNGDRRHSNLAMQRAGQRKKKARLKKRGAEVRAERAAGKATVTEKKPRAKRAPTPAAPPSQS